MRFLFWEGATLTIYPGSGQLPSSWLLHRIKQHLYDILTLVLLYGLGFTMPHLQISGVVALGQERSNFSSDTPQNHATYCGSESGNEEDKSCLLLNTPLKQAAVWQILMLVHIGGNLRVKVLQTGQKVVRLMIGWRDTWCNASGCAPFNNWQTWPGQGGGHQLRTWSKQNNWRSGHQSFYCTLLQQLVSC